MLSVIYYKLEYWFLSYITPYLCSYFDLLYCVALPAPEPVIHRIGTQCVKLQSFMQKKTIKYFFIFCFLYDVGRFRKPQTQSTKITVNLLKSTS